MSGLPEKEQEEWEKKNRAKVHHDQLNRWVFIVSRELAGSDADVERYVRGAVKRLERGSADDVRLIRTSATRITPKGGAEQRRETIPQGPIPFAPPGPVTWAEVEFAWRSATPDVSWPAERFAAGLLPVNDPLQAQILLDSVGKPAGKAKPPQSPIEEALDDVLEEAVETPARTVATVGVLLGLGWLFVRAVKK